MEVICLLDNNLYNLMVQLTEENQSLWRIRDQYQKDAEQCSDCKEFWIDMEKDKEDHIKKLIELIKNHI